MLLCSKINVINRAMFKNWLKSVELKTEATIASSAAQRRWHGWVVRALDLKSGDPEFQSCSDHQLDFLQVVFGSTPLLRFYTTYWSASCQLGFSGFSLTTGSWLKNRQLWVMSCLLFLEIEDGEIGIRLPSYQLLHPSLLLQNLTRTLMILN